MAFNSKAVINQVGLLIKSSMNVLKLAWLILKFMNCLLMI